MSKAALISLGCPKNLVDSNNLVNKLKAKGIFYTSDPEAADIIIINTCGFIEDAKKESVEEILKMTAVKDKRKNRKLIVYGCLAKRHGMDLKKEIPEIDEIWGVGEDDRIVEYCSNLITADEQSPGSEKLTDTAYSYLKIAEGCDRGCSYCVIPDIRGAFRSRLPDEVLRDAEIAVKSGSRELIIVAQDITAYGRDIPGYGLSRLIRDISSISGDFWIRLLYLYPTSINDELIETIVTEKKICRYIDMPLQHSEEKILRLMKRGGSREYFSRLIEKLRIEIPDVAIRTTFIVGFPGETEEDFEGLVSFVQETGFDRLGVFTYSKEEGSEAYGLRGQLSKRIKNERKNRIMEMQSAISAEKNSRLTGKTFRILIDEVDQNISIGRLYSQAPEIDGVVFVNGRGIKKGEFIQVKIEESYDYDLKGTVVP